MADVASDNHDHGILGCFGVGPVVGLWDSTFRVSRHCNYAAIYVFTMLPSRFFVPSRGGILMSVLCTP